MSKKYSQELQDRVVALVDTGKTNIEIAREVGIHADGVGDCLKRAGRPPRFRIISDALKQQVVELYQQGKDHDEIIKLTGVSESRVVLIKKQFGVKSRSLSEVHRTHSCDHSYFAKIDSHNKAQVLGMIAADGCVQRGKGNTRTLIICLQKDDVDYLEFIKNELKYTGPIRFQTQLRRGTTSYMGILCIYSKEIFDDLNRVGIVERKSLTLQFPSESQIPREFIISFIRGYFEGDGTIAFTKPKVSVSAHIGLCVTKEFGLELQKIILAQTGLHSGMGQNKIEQARGINTWVLTIGGNRNVVKFFHWLYKDAEFKMARKYDRFLQILALYDENGNFIKSDEWKENRSKKYQATIARKRELRQLKALGEIS